MTNPSPSRSLRSCTCWNKIVAGVFAIIGTCVLGSGLAIANPDQIQGLRDQFSFGVSSAGQVLMKVGKRFDGAWFQNLRLADLSYAEEVVLDFNPALASTRTLTLTGGATLTNANLAAGRRVELFVTASGGSRAITPPTSSICLGTAPTTIASGKVGKFTFTSTTAAAAGVIYTYAVQP